MKYKIAIFDLDGTILDTLEDLTLSTNAALASESFPQRTIDEVRSFVGNGIRLLIERAVPAGTSVDVTDRVFAEFKRHYKLHCRDNTAPYVGIPEMLATLRAHGMKVAVVSNKADFAVAELCREYFDGLCDLAVGEREGVRRKPAPDAVLSVLDELGIERASAVYIGDSDVDIETAKNAELPCISVTWGFRDRAFLEASGGYDFADSVDELREKLK